MNLAMNLRDLQLWEQGKLKAFAIPQGKDEITDKMVGIKEPFKKLTVIRTVEKNGESVEKKILIGIKYRYDDSVCFVDGESNTELYEEAPRWSPASQLPDFAIRRSATIIKVDEPKSLQAVNSDELALLQLDYASQNDPQLLLEEYLPIKNYELLYRWWKEHYKATLKDCDNPAVVLLHIQP